MGLGPMNGGRRLDINYGNMKWTHDVYLLVMHMFFSPDDCREKL
jgi:hypothetical protein